MTVLSVKVESVAKRKRGFGLASVLLTGLILSVLLTVLMGANSSALSVVRHSEGTLLARSAAESAVSRAIYQLKKDPSFGLHGERVDFQPSQGKERAVIVFDAAKAQEMGVPRSWNNLNNAESVPDENGDVIPARTVRLVARGVHLHEHRTLVVDLHIPPFPYAVATQGTFESMGDLTLTGLSPLTGSEVPGHLLANSTGQNSLTLGPKTLISGDLIAAGKITLPESEIEVGGEVRPYSSQSEIPRIDLGVYDPRKMANSGHRTELNRNFYRNASIQGKVVRDGNLQLSGETTLDGALLFVDGDLEIAGQITGRGALVCTGTLSIRGTQSFLTDNELALLTGGNLSILGNGVDRSKIEGLLYSEGDVEVRNSTVQGTLISQSNGTTSPRVVMERTNLVYDSGATQFSVNYSETPTTAGKYLAFTPSGLYDPGLSLTDKPESPLVLSTTQPSGPDSSLYQTSQVIAQSDSVQLGSATTATSPTTGSQTQILYVGVAADTRGRILIFPPFGSGFEVFQTTTDAELRLGQIVRETFPNTVNQTGAVPWQDIAGVSDLLQSDLSQILAQPTVTSVTHDQQTMSSEGDSSLEIDPMKFLKFGEEMRVRSVRILERDQVD